MNPARRPAAPSTAPATRRWVRLCLLVVYVWVAGLFPAVHALAEQPGGSAVPVEQGNSGLPSGHDHLTCHACAAPASLPSPGATTLPIAAEHSPPVCSNHSRDGLPPNLSGYSDGIPPRAPPSV